MVTFAARLVVVETVKLAAEVIAASRFKAPVISIAPRPPFKAPPTIPLNSTSEDPTSMVKVFASEDCELTVPLKVILLLVVVKFTLEPIITFPAYV